MTNLMEKLAEYEAKGVANIWLIDPRLQQMAVFRAGTLSTVLGSSLLTSDGEIELSRDEIFRP